MSGTSYYRGNYNLRSVIDAVSPSTAFQKLYQTYCFWPGGGHVLEIPVPSGSYTLRLHFAAMYAGTSLPGQRVFSIFAEGVMILSMFDMVAAAGGFRRAVVVSVPVVVRDGALSINMSVVVSDPLLNALELVPAAAAATSAGEDEGQPTVQRATLHPFGACTTAAWRACHLG
jgi:hypothetical protein